MENSQVYIQIDISEFNLNKLMDLIHEGNKKKGFHDKERNTGELLMLVVSELGEAMEAIRKDHFQKGKSWEKDTFEDELTDAIIRLIDLCGSKGIDLEWQMQKKLEFNSSRPRLHGKKL